MSKELLGRYKNGNYEVMIWNDGSKLRYNKEDYFLPDFPESIDCKISNKCDIGCPFCHEMSVPNGALANLNHPIFDSLPAWTELALGGGNVFEHPGLEDFLKRMAARNVICNITVHIKHFRQYYDYIRYLTENNLIHGVGVSVNEVVEESDITLFESIPNLVVHCIAGVVLYSTLMTLANHNLKLLLLGYKTFGRGVDYGWNFTHVILDKIHYIADHMYELREWFPIISFDNLAISQLNLRKTIDEKTWNRTYMGNDGQFTMYLDMVKEECALSSTSERKPINDETNIVNLFNKVREFDLQ